MGKTKQAVSGVVTYQCSKCGRAVSEDFDLVISLTHLQSTAPDGVVDATRHSIRKHPRIVRCQGCGKKAAARILQNRFLFEQITTIMAMAMIVIMIVDSFGEYNLSNYRVTIGFALILIFLLKIVLVVIGIVNSPVSAKATWFGEATDQSEVEQRKVNLSSRGLLFFCLILTAVILLVRPAYLYFNQEHLNDNVFPLLVSSGDEVQIYPDHSLRSVRGEWSGVVFAEIANKDKLDSFFINFQMRPAKTRADKRPGKGSTYRKPEIHFVFRLPHDPDLKGKTLEINYVIDLAIPVRQGVPRNVFEEKKLKGKKQVIVSSKSKSRIDTLLTILTTILGSSVMFIGWLGMTRRQWNIKSSLPPPKIEMGIRLADLAVESDMAAPPRIRKMNN